MPEHQEMINGIASSSPEALGQEPIPPSEIVAKLPTMQQQRVRLDEQGDALIVSPGLAGYAEGDDRVRDEGGRIVMSGGFNSDTPFVLIAMVKMKGWKRLSVTGSDEFRHEIARRAEVWGLELADDDLREYLSAERKRERRRGWLEAGIVYSVVIALGLGVPYLMITGVAAGFLSFIADNPLASVPLLFAIVIVMRLMSGLITGQR